MADAAPGSVVFGYTGDVQFNTLVLYMQGGGVQVISNLQGNFNACDANCAVIANNLSDGDPIGNQGWWGIGLTLNDENHSGNPNYSAANYDGTIKTRDFFSFDLSGVVGTIVGAALELQRGAPQSPTTYVGYNIGAISSTITAADLNNKSDHSGTRDQDFFNALGDDSYGKFRIDANSGSAADILHFALSSAAVGDIGSILGGSADADGRKWINIAGSTFDATSTDGSQDVTVLQARTQPEAAPPTTVPEPASLLLLGAGLSYLGLKRRN